jgi:hypothetical protein
MANFIEIRWEKIVSLAVQIIVAFETMTTCSILMRKSGESKRIEPEVFGCSGTPSTFKNQKKTIQNH